MSKGLSFNRRRRRITKQMKIKFAIRAAITIAVVLLGVAITLAFGRRGVRLCYEPKP